MSFELDIDVLEVPLECGQFSPQNQTCKKTPVLRFPPSVKLTFHYCNHPLNMTLAVAEAILTLTTSNLCLVTFM